MNDIMDDYSYPNDLEIEKRISFYEHTDFQNEVTALLIPDTVQYVHKIFHCMRWATQYRKIVEDVCNQISDCRLKSNQLCQSVEYKVGTLGVDGRAYAQKNIRHWCQCIAETNDCLFQIINIVFCLGYRPWDHFKTSAMLTRLQNKGLYNIYNLLDQYGELIKRFKEFDNYDKHNLSLWGYEKFNPAAIANVEYYLKITNVEYAVSDFLTEAFEKRVKLSLIELLDNVFALASIKNNPKRRYAQHFYDPHDTFDCMAYTMKCPISQSVVPVVVRTKKNKHGKLIADSIEMYWDSKLPTTLFIADLHQEHNEGLDHQILTQMREHSIRLVRDGVAVGTYRCTCKEDKHAAYFHFKEYKLQCH